MKDGEIQEQGESAAVLSAPSTAYTRKLLTDAPSMILRDRDARAVPRARVDSASDADRIVTVRSLVQEFSRGRREAFRAVDDVSFDVVRGTTTR